MTKKFTFFYKPYNYIVNTQKFMRFEEDPTPETLEEHHMLSPVFKNVKMTPWTQNRPESLKTHDRAIDEFSKDFDDCQNWREVHNFMYSGDKTTFDFVMNQLMRTLGVKLKKKVKKRSHKHKRDLKM